MPSINSNRINHKERNYIKRRQKNPHRKKTIVTPNSIPKIVQEKRRIRIKVKKIIQNVGLLPAKQIGTGIDFYLIVKRRGKKFKIPIDFKFCFGTDFKPNNIKIRMTKKEDGPKKLINDSRWTMVVGQNQTVIFFRTNAIKKYVTKNWGRVKKTQKIEKNYYDEYPINIQDMLYQTREISFTTNLNDKSITNVLKKIIAIEFPKPKKQTFTKKPSSTKNNISNKNNNSKQIRINRSGQRKK